MSISKKLDETLDNLDLDSSARELKDSIISKSMSNLKEKMSGLDIHIERQEKEVAIEDVKPHYSKGELAEVAVKVYRTNINPVDAKEMDKRAPRDQPSTIASRANVRSLSRSLAGMRSSGNEGKVSPVGPNGVGNVGKVSPTGDNGVGNVSGPVGSYYALTTDMTLEEYEEHVNNIFEGEKCDEIEKAEKTKKEIKARGGPPGYPDKSVTKEDIVHELEQRLVTLGSTDWIVVDQVLREMARELDVAPRTLSREFKSIHGVFPDKWIKEHLDVEVCGYMPLEEAVRLNKVGKIYEVTFMFRGGTNRLKFFWPHPGDASKQDMQREIEKFWPKGRLIAFYPTIDNEQQSNYMVMAPPVTENYFFMQPEDWSEMSEKENEIFNLICEEEGEPLSPPLVDDEGTISVIIEDHDDGAEREIFFSEKKGLWDNIHAKRKRGEKPAKKGDKDYPKTLNVEGLDQARKNVGASTCWDGYKAKGTKKKDGKEVPNCVKEEEVCPVCGFDPCQCLEGSINEGSAPTDKSYKAPKVPKKKEPIDKLAAFSLERPLTSSMKEDYVTEGGIKSGHKRPTDQGAGLTQKGVDAENAKTGGNLQTAVTTPPSKLKPGSKAAGRRKSFCARSKSWNGERGKAARRRWNC